MNGPATPIEPAGLEEGAALERLAVKNGVRSPVTLRWSHHPGPDGHLLYDIEIRGPFGVARGESSDLFGALQRARRSIEMDGWLLAVEGARRQTHPSGMQRDQAGGTVAYQLESGASRSYPVRGILEDADPSECSTVVEQERWYQEWLSRNSASPRPITVGGRGWAILHPDLANGRRVYQPVVAGTPLTADDPSVPIVYSDRIDALAAGDDEPVALTAASLRREFPRGVDVDPGAALAWRGIPTAFRKLPRIEVSDSGAKPLAGALSSVLSGVRVHGIRGSAALLVVLPAGSDIASAAGTLAMAVGGAVIPPVVLVVAGDEPGQVRRALRRDS